MEKVATQPAVQYRPEPKRVAETAASEALLGREAKMVVEEQTPPTVGMKSRLQMLAEQRKCWGVDGEKVYLSSCCPSVYSCDPNLCVTCFRYVWCSSRLHSHVPVEKTS